MLYRKLRQYFVMSKILNLHLSKTYANLVYRSNILDLNVLYVDPTSLLSKINKNIEYYNLILNFTEYWYLCVIAVSEAVCVLVDFFIFELKEKQSIHCLRRGSAE
jgi:hypothetical protein